MSVFDALRAGGGMHRDLVALFNQPHCLTNQTDTAAMTSVGDRVWECGEKLAPLG